MPLLKSDVWPAVLEAIQKDVGEQRFSLWFRNVRPVRLEGDTAVLGVPNLFVQEWLETHFLDILRRCLAERLGRPATVKFIIDAALFKQAREAELRAGAAIVEEASAAAKEPERLQAQIRPDFTLANFVVGSGNKLAYACAMEILDSSSNRLNPLFIHSLSGLGKTHLLQAMLNEVRRRDDGRTAEYLSAETFTNQFIYAMRNNRLDAFRHRYRNVDILLIDDVHFLGNKSRLQEELLHTFDALHTGNRQFVLASDVHPKMLSKIKQNLVNRFASGMVVRMAPPDFSTRVAIMKIKLQQQARRLPEDVVRYVARGFEGSVRDLTGATTLILAYAGLTGEKIDVNLARTALTEAHHETEAHSGLDVVERVVSRHYSLDAADLRKRRRKRAVRLPRQLCMYLARKFTPMSCREIASHFGAANHSSVISAAARIEETLKKDSDLAELVSAMGEEIRKG
ncbi:MAG: chromosomal replication initiator protein DnaA [Candidatus Brocadiia bacterium]|jgi:chromosomal replication initiator protein